MHAIESERDTEAKLLLLEDELHELYCQMGRQLMEMANTTQKQMDALVDEIVSLRKDLARSRKSQRCARCGGLNDRADRHCRHCGLYLRKEQTV